jgi:hypothetical protein
MSTFSARVRHRSHAAVPVIVHDDGAGATCTKSTLAAHLRTLARCLAQALSDIEGSGEPGAEASPDTWSTSERLICIAGAVSL